MDRCRVLVLVAWLTVLILVPSGRAQDGPNNPVTEDVKTLVQGNNEFAWDLYGRLSRQQANVVFSPYSISTALAMSHAGARGEIAESLAKVLHFTLPSDRLHPAVGKLMADLQEEGKERPFELTTANALWGQVGFPFRPEFLELARKNYRGGFQQVDFTKENEQACRTINRWVEVQTKDKIKELLSPEVVKKDTLLVITNAIYFKAAWTTPFVKELTKDAPFAVTATRSETVPMMCHAAEMFKYYAGEGFQWLELPYKGNRFSMVVLLPQQKGQLPDLEKTLTPAVLRKGLAKLTPQMVCVALPRFKVTLGMSLLADLKKMGMPASPFTEFANGYSLKITDVIHKAFIEVNEAGTEAAAATGVAGGALGLPNVITNFCADHPFLFLIRDTQTDNMLFLGRLTDPSQR